MKNKNLILFLIILLIIPLTLAENPEDIKINNLVNDYAGIFSDAQIATLSSSLQNIYDSKTAEFSIVTINTLGNYEPQMFAQEISEGNLGDETNNGLLLLISIEDRKYWFNVGRGLEPIFNDAKIGRIGREKLVPYFKNNQYFEGSISATNEIAKELQIELTNEFTPPPLKKQIYINPTWVIMAMFIIMSIIRSISAKNQGKNGKKRKNNDNLFLTAMLASSMMRGGGGSFGGGNSFGGFGGGGFGGGGAGGGW